ncbi:hypothetical protein Salat_2647100 [Sesamum alatum]|uniref:Uncharacterized protein n=1 Tax=Sesamum alatum TaxID=300844 RepID=A0AAE2CAW7_9LAMI|nr:hypothetical protein Salat_2647100 [Sesamum alatum]
MAGMSENKCSPSDITVKQNPTGTSVQGKPEFEVTLFNACPCPVANVKLACNGFRTVKKIPLNALVVNGGECSLPKGSFIAPFSGYVFSYAWDSQYQFNVEPTGVTCFTQGEANISFYQLSCSLVEGFCLVMKTCESLSQIELRSIWIHQKLLCFLVQKITMYGEF